MSYLKYLSSLYLSLLSRASALAKVIKVGCHILSLSRAFTAASSSRPLEAGAAGIESIPPDGLVYGGIEPSLSRTRGPVLRSPRPWRQNKMLVAPHFPKGQGFDIPVVCLCVFVCVCVCARVCVMKVVV
jgi:hypothetical protein